MTDEPITPEAAIEWIAEAQRAINNAEQDLACAVAVARNDKALTWQAIGDALGISRQAAWERFGGLEPMPSYIVRRPATPPTH